MRGLVAIFALTVASIGQVRIAGPSTFAGPAKITQSAPVGGSCSDDFNRADGDSLGASWSEVEGDVDIATNRARASSGGFGKNFAIYVSACATTANGYLKTNLFGSPFQYPHLPFRYTNTTTAFYFVQITGSDVKWFHRSQTGGSDTQIGTAAMFPVSGDAICITWTGTGAGTVVRAWVNCTGNSPSAADNWGGAATVTFTDDPASPVDSGTGIGIGAAQETADSITIDNFFAGDLP